MANPLVGNEDENEPAIFCQKGQPVLVPHVVEPFQIQIIMGT